MVRVMSLVAVRTVAEILHLAAMVYGTIVDTELSRKNHERDEKIKKLEAELAELKKAKPKPKRKK